jgi:hypothetical protein
MRNTDMKTTSHFVPANYVAVVTDGLQFEDYDYKLRKKEARGQQ